MSQSKKSANGFDSRRSPAAGRAKAGSRSPGHRGYRPTEDGPKKRRWSVHERTARADHPSTRDHRASGGEIRERGDRAPRGEVPVRADHGSRASTASQNGRSSRGDRFNRDQGPQRAPRDHGARRDDHARSVGRNTRADGRPESDRAQRHNKKGVNSPVRGVRAHRSRVERSGAGGDHGVRRDFRAGRDAPDRFREKRDAHGGPRARRENVPRRENRDRFVSDDAVLERLDAKPTSLADVEGTSFADLGLGGNIVRTLAELGAPSPFPIQAATIPDVLEGRDVLGRGRTGSGKTIAFAAPVVERLMENNGGKGRKPARKPRALVIAPTRELALQIDRTVQPIARSVGLFTTQIYGGVPQHRQVVALQRGVDIVIGTPGRIEDLIDQGRLDLSDVRMTVLDEADHMCDLGFLEPVQRILRETCDGGQRLLFSATLDAGVSALVAEFLVDPAVHEVAGEDQDSSTIDHRILLIEQRDKFAIIEELADRHGKTLVFSRTRAFAEQLADQLDDAGIPATSLHGDLNQARRTRNLAKLTSGRVNVLVATDVAARGIHVDDISLVIQADAPDEYKTYMHRSGRTGRAGRQGTVVTLVSRSRRRRMEGLLHRAEIKADVVPVAPGDDTLRKLAIT